MTQTVKMLKGYKTGGQVDVSWWSDQIKSGIKFREACTHQKRWDEWRKYYRGRWDLDKTLPSAVFFRMLRTIVPRVYFRNPSVSVQPKTPGIENWVFAQLAERVDNKLLRHMKVKGQMKDIVQNTFLFGTGIGKLGFGAEYTPSPDSSGGTIAPRTKKGHQVEYNSLVFPNMPWYKSTHTGCFVVPAGCRDLESAPWVAEKIVRPVDELSLDPRYDTKDLKPTKSKPSQFVGADGRPIQFNSPIDQIEMYEIRDKRTQKVFVVTFSETGNEAAVILKPEDDLLQANNRLNYYASIFNEDDEYFWGIPDSVHLEPHQLESNDIRTMMMYHRRMSLVKLIAKKNSFSEAEVTKLLGPDPVALVEIDGEPLSDIRAMEMSGIPQGLQESLMDVKNEMREDLGFSRNEFGEVGPANARTTKFETQVASMASAIRVDERRDQLADILTDMISDTNHLIFNQWGPEQVIDVVGPGGIQLWVEFKPEMMSGRAYEISIDPDTSVPQTREVREARALRTFEMMRANPLIDPLRLTRFFMHEMHGVQFDDMIRGIPPGTGALDKPFSIEQYMQFVQAIAQQAPQLMGQSQALLPAGEGDQDVG